MIWYVYLVQEFKFVCVPLNFATYLILEYAFYLKDHSYESKDISVCFYLRETKAKESQNKICPRAHWKICLFSFQFIVPFAIKILIVLVLILNRDWNTSLMSGGIVSISWADELFFSLGRKSSVDGVLVPITMLIYRLTSWNTSLIPVGVQSPSYDNKVTRSFALVSNPLKMVSR